MDEKSLMEKLKLFSQNSNKVFLCHSCSHKDVCKNVEEMSETCENYEDATEYKRYSSIHHFFQPIFDWIKFHYPAGEVVFIVDHNSAKMMLEHGPGVFSKEITNVIAAANQSPKEEEKKDE